MADKPDYYDILGVSRDVDEAGLKKAYRRYAMKYHPDRNQGDKASEDKFKELSEAYEVLSDTNKRQTYDQFGHEGMDSRFGGPGGFSGGGSFNDIFASSNDFIIRWFNKRSCSLAATSGTTPP